MWYLLYDLLQLVVVLLDAGTHLVYLFPSLLCLRVDLVLLIVHLHHFSSDFF